VCEGLGEDLRIPPTCFRVAFALGLFFSPSGAVMAYFALGALVLVSRLVFPKPRAARRAAAPRWRDGGGGAARGAGGGDSAGRGAGGRARIAA
jgi:hypothetical protein